MVVIITLHNFTRNEQFVKGDANCVNLKEKASFHDAIMRGDGIRIMNSKRILLIGITSLLGITIMLGGCGMGAKESATVEKYPTKPITVIVPFAAGGSSDIIARIMDKYAPKYLGQSFIIINSPGGSATNGMNQIAGAEADGYTIGVIGPSVILQPLYSQTRYHYPTALEPLAQVVSMPTIVAVSSQSPWNNLNDLINFAKQNPNKIKFGHAGLGTALHITAEMLAKETGIKIVQVPFKGDSEALATLLGGHVQVIFVAAPSALKEHLQAGTIRVLGVCEEQRLNIPGFENVPTFKEQGINLSFSFWQGIVAPKGLPADEKAKLAAGLKKIINEPEFRKIMENVGMEVRYQGPDEFGDQWIADNAKLTNIVKETGIADLITNQKK